MTAYYLYKLRITKLLRDIQSALMDFDAEAIHDVRVSIRRMIALNSVLSNAGKAPYTRKELRILKNKFERAGLLRDIQIQNQLLQEWEKKLQLSFDFYRKALSRRERLFQCHFERAFKTINLKRTIPDKASRSAICREIQKIIEKSYHEFNEKAHGDYPLHPLRITAKKLKYALEIQQSCFPGFGSTEVFRKYLAHIQDLLGTWHDLEMASQYLTGFIKRNILKIANPQDYETLLSLIKIEKEALISDIKKELTKDIPLKEHLSVVLT